MKKIVVRTLVVVFIVLILYPLIWFVSNVRAENVAKQLCEDLVPHLERDRDATGAYPLKIPSERLPTPIPTTVNAGRFYQSDGSDFSFYVRCRSSFWDDVWVYYGTSKNWSSYDDDSWK